MKSVEKTGVRGFTVFGRDPMGIIKTRHFRGFADILARGAQSVLLAAKIRALFEARFAASIDDVRAVALPALRHRVLLNFEGEAEGMKTDQLIDAILKNVAEAKVGAEKGAA